MTETDARKLFKTIKIGEHYKFRHAEYDEDDVYILRVRNKSLTEGKTPEVKVNGIFFFLDARDGSPGCEGLPAGCRSWMQVEEPLTPWEGKIPRRTPIHVEWSCDGCDESMDEVHGDESACCEDTISGHRIAGGKHDGACVCTDCIDEREFRGEEYE